MTLDGLVLNGEFILGGACDKLVSAGPFFEEDLYTFPFCWPEREPELVDLADSITRHLDLASAAFQRRIPRRRVIFGTGTVVRNSAGDVVHSPYLRAYYPMARTSCDRW